MSSESSDHLRCERCREPMHISIVSKFNTQTICLQCHRDERMAPGYAAADRAEMEAVRRGDYNFSGVGLGLRDREFLAERLRQRPLPHKDGV